MDTEFIAAYVQECAAKNKISPKEICDAAVEEIAAIDLQIKRKAKLKEILTFFSYKKKIVEDVKINLDLLNKDLAVYIIEFLKNSVKEITINNFLKEVPHDKTVYMERTILFNIKKMIEYDIIKKNETGILTVGSNVGLIVDQ